MKPFQLALCGLAACFATVTGGMAPARAAIDLDQARAIDRNVELMRLRLEETVDERNHAPLPPLGGARGQSVCYTVTDTDVEDFALARKIDLRVSLHKIRAVPAHMENGRLTPDGARAAHYPDLKSFNAEYDFGIMPQSGAAAETERYTVGCTRDPEEALITRGVLNSQAQIAFVSLTGNLKKIAENILDDERDYSAAHKKPTAPGAKL